MNKKILFLTLFFLSSCSAPGTALLGPIFTGAKTGSVYQASLSYSTNQIIEKVKLKENFKIFDEKKLNKNSIFPDIPYVDKDPIILISYKVNKIEISEVYEPEPLP